MFAGDTSKSRLLKIVAIAVAVRVLGAGIAFSANIAFPSLQRPTFSVVGRSDPFWDSFARYDSGWYYSIARDGYRYLPNQQNTLAYFPLYPLLMRAGGRLLGGTQESYYQAGIAIAWLAFIGAMVMLYRVARLDVDEDTAERAVLFGAVFPFAFFYGMVYTESLFLLLTLVAVYACRRGHWLAGSLVAGLVALTRVNGVLIAPALAWIVWRQAGSGARARLRACAPFLGAAAGLGAFCLFSYVRTGSPLEWMYSIERWQYVPGGAPWTPLVALARQLVRRPVAFLQEPNGLPDTLNGVTAMIFVASVPFVWSRLGAAYGLFMAANLLLPLSSGQFEGLGRYCAVLFPFFIWVASWKRPAVQQLVMFASAALYALCVALFVNLHPIF